jgi:hypothetical protein
MTLIAITKPFDHGVVWINPENVLTVFTTNIGRQAQEVIGTGILMVGMNPIKTPESIESVVQRLQGGAA